MIYNLDLIFGCILASFATSYALTPLVRIIALKTSAIDTPSTEIKTHKVPTPLFGGIAVALAFFGTLAALRFFTSFPTGTLRNLRGIFIGGTIILLTGLIDDMKKPEGLSVKTKFAAQIAAACALIYYGININFLQPRYISIILSIIWVVGIINSINIIDIMDGLSSSQAAAAAMGFLIIALPSEAIYVNFASAALLGAALGFMPHNLSSSKKIYIGDGGSMFMGFMLAAISMGTRYDQSNPLGVYAPLFILAVPIYDTFFVAFMRVQRGCSPFKGSKDHYALRLEKMGYSRPHIVALSAFAALSMSLCALLVTKLPLVWAMLVYFFAGMEFLFLSVLIAKIKMTDHD